MNRRNFIKTTGITLTGTLIGYSLMSFTDDKKTALIHFPDGVNAIINNQLISLKSGKEKNIWTYQDVIVTLKNTGNSIDVFIQAPKVKTTSITLIWKSESRNNSKILNDHWERTYGDISWHKPSETELLPWYFMEYNNSETFGFGVKTGGNTFCGWRIKENLLNLQIDTRSGGNGVELGDRKLLAASIVTIKNDLGETPFQTARRFMTVMCAKARMPKEPVYGINDWYFSYGNNSEKLILEHTQLMVPMAEGLSNRPFSVIAAPINISNYDLMNNDLFPFEYIIKHANPVSLMPSYKEIGGVPNHANSWLIKDVLRKQLGFKGFITSDQSAIDQIHRLHSFVKSDSEAGKIAIENGIDLDLQFNTGSYDALDTLVQSVRLEEKHINESLRKFLKFKYEMGLFENPYADATKMKVVTNSAENKKLALEAAEKAIILLKNENTLLPLYSKKIKTLAVIGPLAKGVHSGGYTAEPRHGIDVLDGLTAYAGKEFKVTYAEGCKLALEESSFWADKVQTPNAIADDKRLIQEAVEVAKQSDVIVLAIGETVAFSREAWGENHLGDRTSLELLGLQNELVTALLATGKPIVAVLFGGRPLAINEIKKNVPAILQAFYLGQEGGQALANVLLGKVNPSGKLAITMPKSAGELPVYYDRQPSRMRSYVNEVNEPLFPFGFGLSYTTYSYGKPTLDKTTISKTENITVTVPVSNTGKVAGEETVQLYIRDIISSGSRPIMELKDFAKVKLNVGESKNITFTITPEKLMFYNYELKKVLESGDFKVMVGPNSPNLQTVDFTVK